MKHFVQAVDGHQVAVSIFAPDAKQIHDVVVVNSGAGIPQSFYGAFAEFLANSGLPAITYDYRGIGGSRPVSLRGWSATVKDWGSKDCAAALRLARSLYPQARLHVVAHSIGGIVTSFVTTEVKIDNLILVSPHTGYLGDYVARNRAQMFLTWHLLMPLTTRIIGYFPGRSLGLPEDLPAGVALEWGSRRFPRDVRNDSAVRGAFLSIKGGIVTVRPYDDLFATVAAARRVLSHFDARMRTDIMIDAAAVARRRLGHFGFFKRRFAGLLWPIALSGIKAVVTQ